jgi:hypothetical protein
MTSNIFIADNVGIRNCFNADPDKTFIFKSIRIRIHGFNNQKNVPLKKCNSLGLHDGHTCYWRSLQPSKKNASSSHFKTVNFFPFFFCCGSFYTLGSGSSRQKSFGSGSTTLLEEMYGNVVPVQIQPAKKIATIVYKILVLKLTTTPAYS